MASKTPKKAKDLTPKSGNVKGGRLATRAENDNMTLVRNAKPTQSQAASA